MKLIRTKSFNTKQFIKNSNALLDVFKIYSEELPVLTENHNRENRSYVTSFLTQYILYAREEVLKSSKYSKQQRLLVKYISPMILQLAKLLTNKKLIWVNSNLTSTPLYNSNWYNYNLEDLSKMFLKHYPKKILIYKSVEPLTNPELFKKFDSSFFIPLLGRQVYIFDPNSSKYKKKRSYQMDKKLSEKQERFYWELLDLNNDNDIECILNLYKKLYLDKHSEYNPVYTKEFVRNGIGKFKLRFEVLKDRLNESIVAVQGINETDNVINTPFIGYDQSLPKKLGLYRLMNYELMRQAIEKEKVLNMSSGAGDFKVKRGGVASFEYQMVYQNNLSYFQRKLWKFLGNILDNTAKKQMRNLKV